MTADPPAGLRSGQRGIVGLATTVRLLKWSAACAEEYGDVAKRLAAAQLRETYNGDWNEYDEAQEDGSFKTVINPQLSEAEFERNLSMFFDTVPTEEKPTHIVRDRDANFAAQFCSILENDGIQFAEIAPHSPNMNPFAERWIQSVRRECLDHFFSFGEKHLRFLLKTYADYFLQWRPHLGLGNVMLPMAHAPPQSESATENAPLGEIVCHERLGGLLRHHERQAA